VDTGMFTSSSFDKFLKVWDTNTLDVSPFLTRLMTVERGKFFI